MTPTALPISTRQRLLGSYVDRRGRAREVVASGGAAGSTLVIDRERSSGEDPRLVAHLAADEPDGNAALVCGDYLRELGRGLRCRPLRRDDARMAPCVNAWNSEEEPNASPSGSSMLDPQGRSYALALVEDGRSLPQLRWCRERRTSAGTREIVSLREAVAALQSYEPLRALTCRGLAASEREHVSTTVLRAELVRVLESPIVLNRRLREAVLATIAREQLTMSEIAMRCGRIKRDRRGNESGETSWLARRIGLLAEGGHSAPTPWIHSDVLALIARCGLGISPREVEL